MTPTMLDAAVRHAIAGHRNDLAVGVCDRRTNVRYTYYDDEQFDCASIVKVQVLAALLQKAHGHLTAWEKDKAWLMITQSDNDATTALWNHIGDNNVHANNVALGMHHTDVNMSGSWGITRTTVGDQLTLLNNVFYGSHVLSSSDRVFAQRLMASVISWQRWGVNGGTGTAAVQLKNGWLPRATHGWRVNSIGHVKGNGRDYTIAVLSTDNPNMSYGVRTIEKVSATVYSALAKPLK